MTQLDENIMLRVLNVSILMEERRPFICPPTLTIEMLLACFLLKLENQDQELNPNMNG